jgi:FemAB-related protein (PEP-CTERM system-associated)
MQVLELREEDREKWDTYVHTSPQATVYHLAGWKRVMEEAFGLNTHYLWAEEDGQTLGVLPLLHVTGRFAAPFFSSMPGAICAQNEDVARALLERAAELVRASGAVHLTLRDSFQRWDLPSLVTSEDHCTMLVRLPDDPDEIWWGVNRRVRQSIKKAYQANLEVVIGPQYLEDLYPAYAIAMREFGTPTFGLAFFRKLLSEFPDQFTVMMVCQGQTVLGGGFVAFFKDTVYNTWGGMLREYYDLAPNYILYWETLKYGCEQGYRWLDLGRSEWESGTFRYKKHWLAEPEPLYHQFFLNGRSQPPSIGSTRRSDFRYRSFVRVWRLLPLPMTEFLGPFLRKRVPFG